MTYEKKKKELAAHASKRRMEMHQSHLDSHPVYGKKKEVAKKKESKERAHERKIASMQQERMRKHYESNPAGLFG